MSQSQQKSDGTFTVDVEDYFQVSAFSSIISTDDWDHYECRVEANTRRVLEIAAKQSTTGTFFILGWVAERYPDLVKEIQNAGHEIGCHSHWHQLVYDLGPERFQFDLRESKDVLQQITGTPVTLYRSPSFSITEKSLWALDILIEEGFTIDSSIYPIRHDRYGIPDSPTSPYQIQTAAGPITQVPGMVCKVGTANIPVGGGGYLRLLPWAITQQLLKRVRAEDRPLNVYIHPWEFDPDQPRIKASWKSKFRHYQNLKTTATKISRMLQTFQLTTMTDIVQQYLPKTRINDRSNRNVEGMAESDTTLQPA